MQVRKMEDARLSDEIITKVVASIARLKEISPEKVRLDSTFEELRMDSLDGLDLFFQLEESFDLTISNERARSLRTVRDIVEEIEKLLLERKLNSPVQT
jgi:acyl carrier protein